MTLRQDLQRITDTLPVIQHPLLIQELKLITGHGIKIIESQYPIESYTCVVHSFGLVEDPTYLSVAGFGLGRTFAGADFINFLLSHELLQERPKGTFLTGDLVIYFQDDSFRHVGTTLDEGRVLSKWGTGYLYDHPVWEVPINYGASVRYFEKISSNAGLELFVLFAQSRGFTFS